MWQQVFPELTQLREGVALAVATLCCPTELCLDRKSWGKDSSLV